MGQRLPRHLRLLEQLGRAGRRQHFRVLALVIVGGGRQRDEHRRLPRRRQLGQRRRPGPADHEVRGFHLALHGEEERLDPGLEAGTAVAVPDEFHIALSCLMRDCQPAGVGCQPRRRLHHGHVDRVRALGAPKDQNPRRATGRRRGRISKELGTNRIAGDKAPPPEVRQRRLERDRRGADERRQAAIREAGHRVLLEQERRNAAQRGDQHHRTRAVAADANHELRPSARHDVPRVEAAERQQRQTARAAPRATCPSARRCAAHPARSPRAARPGSRCRGRSPRSSRRSPAPGAAARARRRSPDTSARRFLPRR